MVFQFENYLISFIFPFFNVPSYIIEQDKSQKNVGAWVIDSLKNAIKYGWISFSQTEEENEEWKGEEHI